MTVTATTLPFTAIFCFNDIAAIGAIRALKDAGLSVPGDVSVVGSDDILSAAYATPSLTTVRQPVAAIIEAAVDLVISIVNDPGRPAEPRLFSCEPVIRNTLRPLPRPGRPGRRAGLQRNRRGLQQPAADHS